MSLTWKRFEVVPAYGSRRCRISWEIEGRQDIAVFVYRSLDGMPPWKRLNDEGIIGWNELVDDFETLPPDMIRPYYSAIAVDSTGAKYPGPQVAAFGEVTPLDMRLSRAILAREYMRMTQARRGVRIMHYRPLPSEVDFNLSSLVVPPSASCSANPRGPDDVGGRGKYRFAQPLQTWMHIKERGPLVLKLSDEGMGSLDEQAAIVRMLAYPQPVRDDLIIVAQSDERWTVTDTVKPYYIGGRIPTAYDVKLALLPREDLRYTIPVPEFRKS